MQYRIIVVSAAFSSKRGFAKLAKEVNEAIALGWEPLGGVAAVDTNLVQAMIKRR